jgi:hypothetical protein
MFVMCMYSSKNEICIQYLMASYYRNITLYNGLSHWEYICEAKDIVKLIMLE